MTSPCAAAAIVWFNPWINFTLNCFQSVRWVCADVEDTGSLQWTSETLTFNLNYNQISSKKLPSETLTTGFSLINNFVWAYVKVVVVVLFCITSIDQTFANWHLCFKLKPGLTQITGLWPLGTNSIYKKVFKLSKSLHLMRI